jgi:transposase
MRNQERLEIPAEVQKHLDEAPPEVKEWIYSLLERINYLEARLRAYENPHVPSSKRIIREAKPPKEQKPRGAPNGHEGATRPRPEPDRVVKLKPTSCPRPGCGSKRIKILKEHKKTVEEIKIVKETTEFHYYECECKDCGARFTTSDKGLPKEGNFGPSITSLWTTLHYIGTIPFARLAAISENCFDMPISPKGVEDAIYRTAAVFEPNFRKIWRRVSKSNYVRSDETSYSFNGKRWWNWNLSTHCDALVLFRGSRGACVLEEVLGEIFDGILNSDCYRGYDRFKAREYQKDWAHVLRDARDLAKHSDEGAELYQMLSKMYRHILRVKREGRENTPATRRWVTQAKRRISEWLKRNHESRAVLNLVLRLSKYHDHWFTCLKYGFVEPTNNASERDIRKTVIARKISGAHRSEVGMHSREIMMSTILTCQKRGHNPFEFIHTSIEKRNMDCFLKPP